MRRENVPVTHRGAITIIAHLHAVSRIGRRVHIFSRPDRIVKTEQQPESPVAEAAFDDERGIAISSSSEAMKSIPYRLMRLSENI